MPSLTMDALACAYSVLMPCTQRALSDVPVQLCIFEESEYSLFEIALASKVTAAPASPMAQLAAALGPSPEQRVGASSTSCCFAS